MQYKLFSKKSKKNFVSIKKGCIFAPKIKQKPDGRPSKEATNTMITLKDVQINSLSLYYTEELIALKAEAVGQAEKMHACGDYTAAASLTNQKNQ